MSEDFVATKVAERKRESESPILKVRVGSHLYGLATHESDIDIMNVWVPSPGQLLGLVEPKQINVNESIIEEKRYPLHVFVRLALKNNPNILEILHADKPNLMVVDEFGEQLIANREAFLSRKTCRDTFLGYAQSQRKKLTFKLDRIKKFEAAVEKVETWKKKGREKCPERIVIKSDVNDKGHWATYEKGTPIEEIHEKLKYILDQYGWRKELIEKYGYDVKFAANLIRILQEGIELMSTGKITFPLKNLGMLQSIRKGGLTLDEVKKLSEDLEVKLEDA